MCAHDTTKTDAVKALTDEAVGVGTEVQTCVYTHVNESLTPLYIRHEILSPWYSFNQFNVRSIRQSRSWHTYTYMYMYMYLQHIYIPLHCIYIHCTCNVSTI